MKIQLALILFLASLGAQATGKHPPKEPPKQETGLHFTNNDKAEHAVFGALFGLAGRLQFRENRWHALAVPAGVGLAKEIFDATQKGNRFDAKDWGYTIAGGLVGVTMGDALIYVTRESGVTRVSFAVTF